MMLGKVISRYCMQELRMDPFVDEKKFAVLIVYSNKGVFKNGLFVL